MCCSSWEYILLIINYIIFEATLLIMLRLFDFGFVYHKKIKIKGTIKGKINHFVWVHLLHFSERKSFPFEIWPCFWAQKE